MKKIKHPAVFAALLLIFSVSLFFVTTDSVSATDGANADTTQSEGESSGSNSEIGNENFIIEYYRGEVVQVETVTVKEDPEIGENVIKQESLVKITSGAFSGRVYSFSTSYNLTDPKQIILSVGTNVMLSATLNSSGSDIASINIFDYYRTEQTGIWFVVTTVIILAVCLFKGIKALGGIVIVTLGLYFYYVPLMLQGFDPILLMVPLCIFTGVVTILLDIGLNYRSFSAIVGLCAGLIFSGLAGFIVENSANLVGLGETELGMLLYLSDHVPVSFTGMTSALAMLISLGGIVDTTAGVTEEMTAMKTKNPYITKMSLIGYGMNQGRSNMSRNINTISYTVLACTIPTWVIYVAYNTPIVEMLNMDFIASLFLRAFCAIIGVVLAMPVTAVVFAQQEKKGSLYS